MTVNMKHSERARVRRPWSSARGSATDAALSASAYRRKTHTFKPILSRRHCSIRSMPTGACGRRGRCNSRTLSPGTRAGRAERSTESADWRLHTRGRLGRTRRQFRAAQAAEQSRGGATRSGSSGGAADSRLGGDMVSGRNPAARGVGESPKMARPSAAGRGMPVRGHLVRAEPAARPAGDPRPTRRSVGIGRASGRD